MKHKIGSKMYDFDKKKKNEKSSNDDDVNGEWLRDIDDER